MAFDGFMKVDQCPGESSDEKHKDWCEIRSFTGGVSQKGSISSTAGSMSSERADFSPIIVTKELDKASAKLMLTCASGQHLKEVIIEICRAGGDKEKYMEIKLTDCLISGYVLSGSAGGDTGIPLEEVSFVYGKLELKYTQLDTKTGKPKGDVAGGWDLKANKKV
jgi:type VI secretion system secreted protein Hcp